VTKHRYRRTDAGQAVTSPGESDPFLMGADQLIANGWLPSREMARRRGVVRRTVFAHWRMGLIRRGPKRLYKGGLTRFWKEVDA